MQRIGGAAIAAVLVVSFAVAIGHAGGQRPRRSLPARNAPITKPRTVAIDLDRAVPLDMPRIGSDLQPVAFRTPDRKEGWVVRIPGSRPIATPAYADGKLFVGGGYGAHEFYAFDAETGRIAWKITTKDDGPTAAVVENGYVAFNTESCTVCVVEARTGRIIWQEWLGDPLMSQPAIANGRLYIAYPVGPRSPAPNAQNALPHSQNAPMPSPHAPAAGSAPGGAYRLLCADLRTGKHLWQQPLPADVISAPIIERDRVLCTCMDGTSFSMNAATGAVVWKKQTRGTSAPLVVNGQVVMSLKEETRGRMFEGIKRLDAHAGAPADKGLLARGDAAYLNTDRGGGLALQKSAQQSLDSSVGFGGGAPAASQMAKANAHLGINSVVGGWSYQGARVAAGGGRLMNAQGQWLNAVGDRDGRMQWRAEAKGKAVGKETQVFSPPALGKKNLYLCTAQGDLLSVRQQDGKVGYLYATRQPMAFQPALARGNMYVGTANGLLMCLKTGDPDADGWNAWGGNARHNKKN